MGYNDVSLPQWQQLVRRVFGLTGPGGNIPVIAPEIQPVVVLQPDQPEFRKLRGEHLWSFATLVTGAVGTRPSVGIINPAGSGVLAVVERAHCSCTGIDGTQSEVSLRIDDEQQTLLAIPNAGTCAPRDTRLTAVPMPGTPAVLGKQGPTNVNPGFFIADYLIQGDAGLNWVVIPEINPQVVLLPGFGLFWIYTAAGAGSGLSAGFSWYERKLETAEQTG